MDKPNEEPVETTQEFIIQRDGYSIDVSPMTDAEKRFGLKSAVDQGLVPQSALDAFDALRRINSITVS